MFCQVKLYAFRKRGGAESVEIIQVKSSQASPTTRTVEERAEIKNKTKRRAKMNNTDLCGGLGDESFFTLAPSLAKAIKSTPAAAGTAVAGGTAAAAEGGRVDEEDDDDDDVATALFSTTACALARVSVFCTTRWRPVPSQTAVPTMTTAAGENRRFGIAVTPLRSSLMPGSRSSSCTPLTPDVEGLRGE